MEATHQLPPHVLPVPRWTLIIHAAQAVLAIIILGLDAYGIRWIAYNVLIYSLVCAICTLGVVAYLLGSQLALHQFYNKYVVVGLNIWMIIFWIVDLGLVANLARIWSGPNCTYVPYYGYSCSYGYYYKRDTSSLAKRESTTYTAYYGALAAGAFFGAVEFGSFIVSLVFTLIYLNKERTASPAHPPPQYTDNNQAVPLENKYNSTAQVQPQQYPQQPQQAYQQQSYSSAQTPQTQYAQPAYPQDPVNRANTVSPMSNVGYSNTAAPPHTSELASPQHTGGYNPNVSELSTPQHTGAHNPYAAELK